MRLDGLLFICALGGCVFFGGLAGCGSAPEDSPEAVLLVEGPAEDDFPRLLLVRAGLDELEVARLDPERSWVILPQGSGPDRRVGFSAAYDPSRGHVVVFGGGNDDTCFDETWVFEGGSWRKLDGDPKPAARARGVLEWNEATEEIELSGGEGSDCTTSDEDLDVRWFLSGDRWRKGETLKNRPRELDLETSGVGLEVTLLPSEDETEFAAMMLETYLLTDNEWSSARASMPWTARGREPIYHAALAWDAGEERALYLMSYFPYDGWDRRNATLLMEDGAWRLLDLGAGPSPRYSATAVRDPSTRAWYLYGGMRERAEGTIQGRNEVYPTPIETLREPFVWRLDDGASSWRTLP